MQCRVQLTSDYHGACDRPCCASDGNKINVHRVDDVLEVEGHLHVEQLCAYEEAYAQSDPEPGAQVVLGPQVLGHLLHDGPVSLALLLVGECLLLQQGVCPRNLGRGGGRGRFGGRGGIEGGRGGGGRPLAMGVFSVEGRAGEDADAVVQRVRAQAHTSCEARPAGSAGKRGGEHGGRSHVSRAGRRERWWWCCGCGCCGWKEERRTAPMAVVWAWQRLCHGQA